MNANHQTNDFIRLRKMSCFWGDIFTGTKAQLNAIGFGVDCAFPGEPHAAKKQCKLPATHGYKRVDVRIDWLRRLESDKPFDERNFEVWAHHLETERETREKPIQFAPGVVLKGGVYSEDHYIGTAQSLIQAGVIEERQLPGMPGCGKCTTTFDADGSIFKRGSVDWHQPGFKVVKKYGKKIVVICIASTEEQERRVFRRRQGEAAYELACLEAKRKAQACQSAPRPRPALRLVWSA